MSASVMQFNVDAESACTVFTLGGLAPAQGCPGPGSIGGPRGRMQHALGFRVLLLPGEGTPKQTEPVVVLANAGDDGLAKGLGRVLMIAAQAVQIP